jgi:glycosyltransferase involved in cell wall biosynthesis
MELLAEGHLGVQPDLGARSTATPRRIVAIIATNDVSGPGRQLVLLATGLTKMDVSFTILLLNRPGAPTSFADFVRDHGVDCRVVTDRNPIDPITLHDVARFLSRIRPDVVQTHSYKPAFLVFALRRWGALVPWVGFFEGQTDKDLKDRIYNRAGLLMLRSADDVVVMSQLQRNMFPAAVRQQVHVIHNAVPGLAVGSGLPAVPLILRRRRGSGSGRLIGVVGRLSREKGVDIFLHSLARLASRVPAVTGVVIGEGAIEANLRAQAERLNLGDRVVFTGHVDDIASAYSALDLMVVPSRSEGLPSVLLEALQADLPVVSTSVGAMIEIATAHPGAFDLIPPQRPDLLAQGMASALDRAGEPERSAARRRVVEAFSSEVRCRKMMQVYSGAIRRRRGF